MHFPFLGQFSHNARYVVVGLILWAWKALPWVSLGLFVHCQRDSTPTTWRSSFLFVPFLPSVYHVVFCQTRRLSCLFQSNLACLSVVCSVWVCLSREGQWMSFGFWNVLRHTGGCLPFWYKLSLNYLNSIRVFICCAAEGNRKCISGPVMAVLNSFIIFSNCIGCKEQTAQAVWWQAAKGQSQKWLQKIHFLFYMIAVASLASVGMLQWLYSTLNIRSFLRFMTK